MMTLREFRGGSRTAATSKMERFVIIVNGWKPSTIITKHSILDVAAALDPTLEFFKKEIVLNLAFFKSPDNTSVRAIFPSIITVYHLVRIEFSIDAIYFSLSFFYEYSQIMDSRGRGRAFLTPTITSTRFTDTQALAGRLLWLAHLRT